MKKYILLLAAILVCGMTTAQDVAKKAAKSVFTLKTFDADGNMLASSNGFFVGENGEAISNFAPFRGASRAVVIDATGKEYSVESMLGANDMYDMAKFRVAMKKSIPLAVAQTPAAEGTTLWLVPYSVKKTPACPAGKVSKIEKVANDYEYYTIGANVPENTVSCPFVNEAGEVVAILQPSHEQNDSISYAVSAKFAADMRVTGLSINDPTLKSTGIKTALSDDIDQAILTLFVGSSLDSTRFAQLVEDFIVKFPDAADGYVYRAQLAAMGNRFEDADKDMATAISVTDKKDDAHYSYAKLIFQKLLYKADVPYEPWTYEKAISETDEAIKINPQNIYSMLKGQMLFANQQYAEAYDVYNGELERGTRTAEVYFGASRCKEMLGDTTSCIALLDSTVGTFSKPYLKEAAPYLLARAQVLYNAGKSRLAVLDFNEYEKLMSTSVNDNFYYVRAQAEMSGHLYQQALDDLTKAISMNPRNTLYYAEKASLELRVSLVDEAIATATECIAIDPNLSDGYLFLGLGQCLKDNKAEGVKNLRKALELGDKQAEGLIEKYGK